MYKKENQNAFFRENKKKITLPGLLAADTFGKKSLEV